MSKSEPGPGHNSSQTEEAKAQLKSFIERVERLEEEKKAIADDIKDVFGEAKSNGFDVKALRDVLRRRKMDRDALLAHEALVETYESNLGVLG